MSQPSLSVDHVVITVEDLAVAVLHYTDLGFNVLPGGVHTGGASHNALIVLPDGAYLELLAFTDPSVLAESRRHWADGRLSMPGGEFAAARFRINAGKGEGLTDYALLAEDIGAVTASGVPVEGPTSGGRQNPGGAQMRWQVAMPHSPALPFVIADETARALRVPERSPAREQPNGVTGIAEIVVAVWDLAGSARLYEALLGSAPAEQGDGTARFEVSGTSVTLAADHEVLPQRGEGPAELVLRASGKASSGYMDAGLAHGARLRVT